ncbi:hypothetical protein [Leisingera sp. M658]|uniref:hypothetical protein n=1 Tax=Leisingera sp. M658 TaxID=2867015 RepID=UPI002882D52B|nr:hypothetical protein [Leisingera sp. M658]
MSAKIIERIEAVEHSTYAEPFVGIGAGFFCAGAGSRSWKWPMTQWGGHQPVRILQQHHPYLMDMIAGGFPHAGNLSCCGRRTPIL